MTTRITSLVPLLEQARQEFPDCIVNLWSNIPEAAFVALGVRAPDSTPMHYRYTCIGTGTTIEALREHRAKVCLLSERPTS